MRARRVPASDAGPRVPELRPASQRRTAKPVLRRLSFGPLGAARGARLALLKPFNVTDEAAVRVVRLPLLPQRQPDPKSPGLPAGWAPSGNHWELQGVCQGDHHAAPRRWTTASARACRAHPVAVRCRV